MLADRDKSFTFTLHCECKYKETKLLGRMSCRCCRYGLMRELGDGTCRPCTTSEVAALTGEEPPTRSPSVNPVRPLRVPVRPALSPLGRPNLAAAPGPLVEARSAADLQDTSRQPREAPEASATQPVLQEFGGPDEAAGPDQQSMQPCGNRDKENGAPQLPAIPQCMDYELPACLMCSLEQVI